jgi:hypothetical protein
MVRRVFFSYHYERDCWRANQVRNSWVTKPDRESAGFIDAANFEDIKKQGSEAIERWINNQMEGTTVTVILIGAHTSERDWVKYEIKRSVEKGKGLLGIYIHNMKDNQQNTDFQGHNPLDDWTVERNEQRVRLSQIYDTYDWVAHNGYDNLGDWVEAAAQKAGK